MSNDTIVFHGDLKGLLEKVETGGMIPKYQASHAPMCKFMTAFFILNAIRHCVPELVPRTPTIQACEIKGKAVLEYAPNSREAEIFRELARKIMENDSRVIPTPMEELSDLETMYREHLP